MELELGHSLTPSMPHLLGLLKCLDDLSILILELFHIFCSTNSIFITVASCILTIFSPGIGCQQHSYAWLRWLLSGMGPIPVRPGSVSTGIDPMCRGLASLKGPLSLLSQRPKQSFIGTLQGLTCD